MKTEEFDDAIRKKLDSINPSYSDTDIENVFRHVKKNRGFHWKGLNGSWLLYTLSAAAMVSVTTWMVLRPSHKENAVRKAEKTNIVINTTPGTSVAKADSAAVPEVITPQSESNTVTNSGNITSNAGGSTSTAKVADTKPARVNPQPLQANNAKVKVANSSSQPTKSKDTKHITASSATAAISENANYSPKATDEMPLSSMVAVAPVPEVATPQNTQQIVPQSYAGNVQPISGISETIKPDTTADVKISTDTKPALSLNADTTLSNPETQNRKITGFGIRPAVLFNVSGQKVGTGVAADILIGKYFGFTTGITYSWLKAENFKDKADMYGHRPAGINPPIDHHLGNEDHISDIEIKNTLLQLPLSFNYFIPLKHGFTVRLSLGTQFDIYLNQKLSYNHRVDSANNENPHFQSQGKVDPFNTLFFGAGLEKRWNHLSISAQPFYNQRLKDVFYKPKESEFGFGLSVMYSFGK